MRQVFLWLPRNMNRDFCAVIWCLCMMVTLNQAIASNSHDASFLVLSDVHVQTTVPHVMNFMPDKASTLNDIDPASFEAMLVQLQQNINEGKLAKPRFILYLGDMVGHLRLSANAVLNSETLVFHDVQRYFPDTPLLYVFGNNDSFSQNYGPFSSTFCKQSPMLVAQQVNKQGGGFLSSGVSCLKPGHAYPCLDEANPNDGYYTVLLEPTFRLVALNTVMFSPRSSGVTQAQALQQLQWFKRQMLAAKQHHESVIIAMHVPPGKNVYDGQSFWNDEALAEFLHGVELAGDALQGILAAHTHKDEIKRIENSAYQPLMGVFLNAAMSTSHGNAPSVRVYYYGHEAHDWHLTDYDSYFFTRDDGAIAIKKLYNYHEVYCHADEKNILACLRQVSLEQMLDYFTAGNPNFKEQIKTPDAINIRLNSWSEGLFHLFQKIGRYV